MKKSWIATVLFASALLSCKNKFDAYYELKDNLCIECTEKEWETAVDSLNQAAAHPDTLAKLEKLYRIRNIVVGNIELYMLRRHNDHRDLFYAHGDNDSPVYMRTYIDQPVGHNNGIFMSVDTTSTRIQSDKEIMRDVHRYIKNENKINTVNQRNSLDSVNRRYGAIIAHKKKQLDSCYNELYR